MTENTDLSPMSTDVRRYDYDRWLSCLFAPKEARERLFAILAFNIEIARVRETVSEPLLGDIRLQWWRDALKDLSGNISKSHPVVESLHEFNKEHPVDFNLMLEMVDIRAKDLDPAPIETTGDLLVYADMTGGALHQLLYRALGGGDNSNSIEAVVRSGRSYALTGILRAMPFHAQNGLNLMPTKALADYSLTADTVFKPENRIDFFEIVKKMTDFAQQELKEAKSQVGHVNKGQRAAILCNALSGIYLKRLENVNFEPADPRMDVGGLRKVVALSVYKLMT
ncbi:MAG: squalene/phytoene synthase family protein [Sneathiella sp.]|nr:squalene/phytoene synthase family protein [Sneathiella sp.]